MRVIIALSDTTVLACKMRIEKIHLKKKNTYP